MSDDKDMSRKSESALFGGPFGIALVFAVLASIAAIPLMMKLAPPPGQIRADESAAVESLDESLSAGTEATVAIMDDDHLMPSAQKDTLAIKEYAATDAETGSLIGGRIMLVSASGPGVVLFDNGSRYTSGTVMPNGHVIASIESDRIVLEREKVVSVVRLQ